MTTTHPTEWEATDTRTTLRDLEPGDYIVYIPTQMGMRGFRVDSGLVALDERSWDHYRMAGRGGRSVESARLVTLANKDREYGQPIVPLDSAVVARRAIRTQCWHEDGSTRCAARGCTAPEQTPTQPSPTQEGM